MDMAKLVLCLCLCVQLVVGQFGFFNQQDDRPLNFLNPSRIRDRLSGFLHPHRQNQNKNPGGNSFNRPSNEYGTPGVVNENQNQFGIPNRNGFVDQDNQQNGVPEPPSVDNGVQEPNNDGNEQPKEENNGGLIVIPGGSAPVFGGFVFPDTPAEKPEDTTTTKAPEPASPAEEYPPLTPVPSTDTRNNFNFGPSGIFQETCQTVDNDIGSCIQISECQPYMALIQQSRNNPRAVQLLRQAHCGFQGNNPKVCCPRPGFSTEPPPSPTTTTTTTTTTTESPVIMPEDPEQKPAAVQLPEAPICGLSNATFSRVVNGVPAKLGDFPWMALLGYKGRRSGEGPRWLCGGSLISERHVLTAAHCIHTREDDLYQVRLGELDIAREDEGATPIDVPIKKNIKHEEYNPKAFTNDIGILVLSRNVQYTGLITPICIPRSSELRARSYENYNPLIAGWGDTEFRGPAATHLQVLQLPVVSNDYCAQAYKAYKAQVIDSRVLCAGFKKGGSDACQGDSGGPLMQPIWNSETLNTFFYQIGVVSFGKKCAEPGFPGVYTRVTNFVPWIEQTVANN